MKQLPNYADINSIQFYQLAKKLKTGPFTKVDQNPDPCLEWHAHLFTASRTQYIHTTELIYNQETPFIGTTFVLMPL